MAVMYKVCESCGEYYVINHTVCKCCLDKQKYIFEMWRRDIIAEMDRIIIASIRAILDD